MAPAWTRLFGRRSDAVPALDPVPPVADLPPARLQGAARYLGTFDEAGERVVGQTLSARSAARLSLSKEALDVVRIAGSFRIRAESLRGASTAEQFSGEPVPDLLLVRWQHHDRRWETGFRMEPSKSFDKHNHRAADTAPDVAAWVRTISKMARHNDGGDQ